MGKNMYTRHVDDELDELEEVEHVHPSCMWGIMHAIDYHHWHFNLKKMLLQKINLRKRVKGSRSSKAKELVQDPRELKKLVNEEEKHIPGAKKSGSNNKRGLKSRIKSLIAEEMSNEGNGKERGSSISSQPRLQRTYSIHHLEPPDQGFGEICSDGEHPFIFFPSNKDKGATKLSDPAKMNVKDKPDAYGKKSELRNEVASKDKERTNVLEVFKVNKDLFLEIVQDKDGSLRKFSHALHGSNVKARLAKSGSFPATDLVQKRTLQPSTLKQKQSEIWSVSKVEKLPAGTLVPKLDKFKHSKHVRSKSLPLEYSSSGSKLGQALNFILESTSQSDEGNREVVKPLTESKQLDQLEVREDRNLANSSAISVLSEASSGNVCSKLEKDSAKRYEKTATSRVDEETSFSSYETVECSFGKNTRSHRRSSSLNESMDKYTWLFENNFGKEVNLRSSGTRSLKLRDEYEMGSGGKASISFRRIRSLANVEIYSSLRNMVHDDANLEGWPITMIEENSSCEKVGCPDEMKPVVVSPATEGNAPAGDIEESVHQNELQEKGGFTIHQMDNLAESRENIPGDFSARMKDFDIEADFLTVDERTLNVGQAISPSELPPCLDLAFETYSEEEVSSSAEFQVSEGLLNRCNEETDSSINCWKSLDFETSSLLSSMPNVENLDHLKDTQINQSYNDNEADLDYVKDILENSGFAKDAFHKTWHSSNQPLDPLVFDEMEAYWHKECSAEDYCGCDHHQLVFDLVNEKLLNIYERSFTYYPKALSSSCYIRPFPVGDHFVDEMCSGVNTLMRLKPEQKQSLECLVALDMGKDDGWMNLQLESECMGLELEDLIFDELLEELVCS
ncbi:hypothetical protein ACH5RR_020782 [Cinchona calisaya]|uniref:DUF4378 domain-containing protein n=1 Tax=Cinchona calisaya TaxID=153742 RepID=A0ABD2ZKG3_9GENT